MIVTVKYDNRDHPWIESGMYVQATGRHLPVDFLITQDHSNGIKTGIRPVVDDADVLEVVRRLDRTW